MRSGNRNPHGRQEVGIIEHGHNGRPGSDKDLNAVAKDNGQGNSGGVKRRLADSRLQYTGIKQRKVIWGSLALVGNPGSLKSRGTVRAHEGGAYYV